MKYQVYVATERKEAILDPQGKATQHALASLGMKEVGDVRIGKFIRIDVTASTKDEAVKVAQGYLETLSARLKMDELANQDIAVKTKVESDPDVAEAIIKRTEDGPIDLIAMATHGRGGMRHFVMGSVTERVLHHSKLPLLIVRPPKEQTSDKKEKDEQGREVDVTEVEVHS